MDRLIKGHKYKFIYSGNARILKKLNGYECTVCARYLNQSYVSIKFANGIETIAYPNELAPI